MIHNKTMGLDPLAAYMMMIFPFLYDAHGIIPYNLGSFDTNNVKYEGFFFFFLKTNYWIFFKIMTIFILFFQNENFKINF